ncbi:MAG: hypothetical protein QMD22_00365 [archaeon]|nr:hypothetical protein [archaeon]
MSEAKEDTGRRLEDDIPLIKEMGLVNEVFSPDRLASLHGTKGMGHVRYSTAVHQRYRTPNPYS